MQLVNKEVSMSDTFTLKSGLEEDNNNTMGLIL